MSYPVRIGLVRLLLSLNEWLFTSLRLKNYYRSVLQHVHAPVIVDVGANRGQSIHFFLSLNKRSVIYAFEPNPELYQQLCTRYQFYPNVHLFPFAVSDTTGEALFRETVLDETSTLSSLNYSSAYLKRKAAILGVAATALVRKSYKVQTIMLCDFFSQQSIKAVDVLKIDTEGHEAACLRGLFNRKDPIPFISCIQMEQHHHDMYMHDDKEECAVLLQQHGFGPDHRIRHGFGHFYELLYRPVNLIRS